MKKKVMGVLLIAAGLALLILLRMHPDDSCEHNPSVVLKGTHADCEAREIRPRS
jgi:hypothetical protein